MKATEFNERVRCFVYKWFSRNPYVHIKTMELREKAKEFFNSEVSSNFIHDCVAAYENSINNYSIADERLCKEVIGDEVRGYHNVYWLERHLKKEGAIWSVKHVSLSKLHSF